MILVGAAGCDILPPRYDEVTPIRNAWWANVATAPVPLKPWQVSEIVKTNDEEKVTLGSEEVETHPQICPGWECDETVAN